MSEATIEEARARWNGARFVHGSDKGAYESWFQRANHPSRPLAFWIRYTIFSPRGRPADAIGELWAVFFDGEKQRVVAVKEEHPLSECRFAGRGLDAHVASAHLDQAGLSGSARRGEHSIGWDLRFASDAPPLLLLPERLYEGGFPKAKALVGAPLARYDGSLEVDGERVAIEGWVGSQNHNWGSQHTDRYAWGQVAGFDGAPETFLEVSTARVRVGPLWSPRMTLLVLRHEGRDYALNDVATALRADGRYDYFTWKFSSRAGDAAVEGRIDAPRERFVGLPYDNPPGGRKTCLNTKLARCALTLRREGRAPVELRTEHRAAFEILTDRGDHGVSVLGV